MKKFCFAGVTTLLAACMALVFTGCPNNPENPEPTGGTLQSQIDNAQTGGTVSLNNTMEGNSIVISKALTVDGGNLENISITVSSSVKDAVTLKNFKKAAVTVSSEVQSANTNVKSRAADSQANEADEKFKKYSDDVLPLHIEGCTIEKFEAKDDVALYLGTDEKKSEIEELNLKKGVEDFTFIEFDKADKPETTENEKTATEYKSKVGKLYIEDNGIEKINLIGGTFDNVDFANGFSGEIDFKYDKEFDDQLNFSGKNTFLENEKINAKDIGVAEFDPSLNVNKATEYAFSIPNDMYEYLDGRISVVFLTDAQKEALEQKGDFAIWCAATPGAVSIATYENPIYLALPSGAFRVDYKGNSSSAYKTIYGTEGAYINYANAISRGLVANYEKEDVVVLDNYKNYNKEAFIAELGTSDVTIHVNMAAIKKDDVLLCAACGPNGQYGEAGTKLTEIDLSGYKPYLMINWEKYNNSYTQSNPYPDPSNYITIVITDENKSQYIDSEGNAIGEYLEQLNAFQTVMAEYNANYDNPRQFAINSAITTYNGNSEPQKVETFIPYGESVKLSWEFRGTMTPMVELPFPSVTNVSYSVIPVSEDDKEFAKMILQQFEE